MKNKNRIKRTNTNSSLTVTSPEDERSKQFYAKNEEIVKENISNPPPSIISENSCTTKNCSHYIEKNRLHLYKGKFLFSIIIFTLAIIGLFVLFHISHVNSQDKIITAHQNFCNEITHKYLETLTVKKDSTIVLDKVITDIIAENQKSTLSLLDLQYNKLQNDFAILSLWAGILMIVFLIFSIYSIFKVDEMQKQGRDYLLKIEEISSSTNKISETLTKQSQEKIDNLDKMAQEEMTRLSTEYERQITELTEEIAKIQKTFEKAVKEKIVEFEGAILKYKSELKQNSINNEQMLFQFVEAIKKSATSSNKEQKG